MPKKMWNKPHSKITNHLFIYDIESSAKSPHTAEVLEFFGVVVDVSTLNEKEDGVFGPVLVKPTDWSLVEPEALKVNNLVQKEIEEKGLDPEVFFNQLTAFLRKFQKSDKKWDALIPGGFNTNNYDNIIMNRMAVKYNYVDSDKSPKLFHPFHEFDLMPILRPWFYSTNTLESFSLENVRNWFGITNTGAHTAEFDVRSTSKILCRYLKFYKELSPKFLPKFKNCFGDNQNVASS